jgi:hypothetical protein
MGNLTPKPITKHINKKFISVGDINVNVINENLEVPVIKNKYKNKNIKNKAPNWVQKNIR